MAITGAPLPEPSISVPGAGAVETAALSPPGSSQVRSASTPGAATTLPSAAVTTRVTATARPSPGSGCPTSANAPAMSTVRGPDVDPASPGSDSQLVDADTTVSSPRGGPSGPRTVPTPSSTPPPRRSTRTCGPLGGVSLVAGEPTSVTRSTTEATSRSSAPPASAAGPVPRSTVSVPSASSRTEGTPVSTTGGAEGGAAAPGSAGTGTPSVEPCSSAGAPSPASTARGNQGVRTSRVGSVSSPRTASAHTRPPPAVSSTPAGTPTTTDPLGSTLAVTGPSSATDSPSICSATPVATEPSHTIDTRCHPPAGSPTPTDTRHRPEGGVNGPAKRTSTAEGRPSGPGSTQSEPMRISEGRSSEAHEGADNPSGATFVGACARATGNPSGTTRRAATARSVDTVTTRTTARPDQRATVPGMRR